MSELIASRYRLIAPLGSGGSADTFRALDLLHGTEVALKVFAASSDQSLDGFRDEFSNLASLVHPHLIGVHDFGIARDPSGPRPYYSCALVPGPTLDRFAKGRPWREVVSPLCDALEALDALHASGLRHGDFKPQNIIVDETTSSGVLIDLGCARPLGQTAPANLAGTPEYIAPELFGSSLIDHRADLFAVGVVLDRLARSLQQPPPQSVRQLAQRLRAKNPDERPAQVDEVLELLGRQRLTLAPLAGPAMRLLGRSTEVAAIDATLDSLLQNNPGPRIVWIEGSEGMGRSSLLREIKWMAQLRCDVVQGDVRATDPIRSMLERAAESALPDGIASAFAAQSLLAQRHSPVVIVLDDVHRLSAPEAATLRAFFMAIDSNDPVLLVVTSLESPQLPNEQHLRLELGPLGRADVQAWSKGRVSSDAADWIAKATHGVPALIGALMVQLKAGDCGEADIKRLASKQQLSFGRRAALAHVSEVGRRALGLCVVLDGRVSDEDASVLGASVEAWRELLARGLVQREPGGYKLVRAAQAAQVEVAIEATVMRSLHSEVAARHRAVLRNSGLDELAACEAGAQAVRHLASAGELEAAQSVLLELEPHWQRRPQWWLAAVDVCDNKRLGVRGQLAAARIMELAGHPERALVKMLNIKPRPKGKNRTQQLRQLGSCHMKRGEVQAARSALDEALLREPHGEGGASSADILCRVLIQAGEYEQAIELANRALTWTSDPEVQALHHENLGVAASYLGRADEAEHHLDQAEASGEHISPRNRVRLLSYRAIHHARRGDVPKSAHFFREALRWTEKHGLADQLASAALNLGTACHQQGAWGDAMASYETAMRTAQALGQEMMSVAARFNLAQLCTDAGAWQRAEPLAQRARQDAQRGNLAHFEASAITVLGEIAWARGDTAAALSSLRSAEKRFRNLHATRETVELQLLQAEFALSQNVVAEAEKLLTRAKTEVPVKDSGDLAARLDWLLARVQLQKASPAEARQHLENAASGALESHQLDLNAAVQLSLAEVFDSLDVPVIAQPHRDQARELWERMATSLPDGMQSAFWRHPRRRRLAAKPSAGASTASDRERNLERLLDINRKLNSSLDTLTVLGHAMDAAIELTRAERGFVILRDDQGSLSVPVARNLDREKLNRSHAKFSHGIAMEVIKTGEPVVTVDASTDTRFRAQASVHAMRLRSIIAVPIRAPDGVLGALYLDNRFERERFGSLDIDALLAFSDQVALALRNARLHVSLEKRTRELEKERSRVAQLVRGQAERIDELMHQVELRQKVLEHRFDYSRIVGQSAAMQRVFSVLDRVIDTSLTVLIRGESGTGKELVAQAIHFNGTHRPGPFVAINCAALPELLLESELFGHRRGAFTGADRHREGLMVSARGGTLFLDEVGEMSPGMQAKLLRAVQEHEVLPLGATKPVKVDFRLLCATNRDLKREVQEGNFREDLYYRIGVIEIEVPPLRERTEDIPALAEHLLSGICERLGREPIRLARGALLKLSQHPWNGNVRELENILTKAAALADSTTLSAADIELNSDSVSAPRAESRSEFQQCERETILNALQTHDWNVAAAARSLGTPRGSLYRKLERYKIGRGKPR